MKKIYLLLLLTYFSYTAAATEWLVGPSRSYTSPSKVASLVQDGDTVSIDVGVYASDVAHWTKNNLLFRGIGGMAHLKSNGANYGDKAIWVIGGNNNIVEWVEFSECKSTSLNGAGIRQEGLNLTVRHCYFHDNEDGILAGKLNPSKMIIEFSEFNHNGAGDGYSHNLYIGNIDTLVFRYNYSHLCNIGHELKSRANVNYIMYNRLSNEATGLASREMDLPNGGTAYIIGNVIEQGPNSTNSGIIGYGLEGITNPTPHELYLINNTIVNDRSSGTFVSLQTGMDLFKSYNNIFAGKGTLYSGAANTIDTSHNIITMNIGDLGFVDATKYDYHLTTGSIGINAGTTAGTANSGFVLSASKEYKHPADSIARQVVGSIDIGAYEFASSNNSLNRFTDLRNNFHCWLSNGSLVCAISCSSVVLNIYDINGKLLLSKNINQGISQVELNNLSSGIYIYEARSASDAITGKFIR